MTRVRRFKVVLAVDPNNLHARRLVCLRRAYFGYGDEIVMKNEPLTARQRRVMVIWRRFGGLAYTEVA